MSDQITPPLYQLHRLKVRERIKFKLAVLTYRCIHGMAPTYLADELLQPADLGIRTRLRSALTTSLPVLPIRRTQLSTVGDRAFPIAAATRTWNDLPRHVTSASSLPVFRSRLKTHLFRLFFSVTFVQCLQSDFCHY